MYSVRIRFTRCIMTWVILFTGPCYHPTHCISCFYVTCSTPFALHSLHPLHVLCSPHLSHPPHPPHPLGPPRTHLTHSLRPSYMYCTRIACVCMHHLCTAQLNSRGTSAIHRRWTAVRLMTPRSLRGHRRSGIALTPIALRCERSGISVVASIRFRTMLDGMSLRHRRSHANAKRRDVKQPCRGRAARQVSQGGRILDETLTLVSIQLTSKPSSAAGEIFRRVTCRLNN